MLDAPILVELQPSTVKIAVVVVLVALIMAISYLVTIVRSREKEFATNLYWMSLILAIIQLLFVMAWAGLIR